MDRRAWRAMAVGVLAAAAVLSLFHFFDYFEQLNSLAYDFALRLAGPIQPSSPVSIVSIDEDSLERVGRWPWPRHKLAELMKRIESGHPRVIAFDMLLDDRTNPDEDAALAEAIRHSKAVVLAAQIGKIDDRYGWRKPLKDFVGSNVRLGNVHAEPDVDGITRRVFSLKESEGTVIPALSFEALRAAGFPIDRTFEESLLGAQLYRPQAVNIRFAGNPQTTFPHSPAWRILEGETKPADFQDRIVLIGATAEGLGDQWVFPPFSGSGRKMSGVEIHANAIETLYGRRWIVDVPAVVMFVGLTGLFVLLWWFERRFEDIRFYAVSLALSIGTVVLSWGLMKYANTWFAFPPFLLTIVASVPALGVRKLVRVNRDLDTKIEKLSRWGESGPGNEWDPALRISQELPDGQVRDGWLRELQSFEGETGRRLAHRKSLLAQGWRNSRWRLGAVDFFNEELIRFLSFNSAILHSIEDVIVVADVAGRVVYQNPAASRLENYKPDPPFAPDYVSSLLDGRKLAPVFGEVFAERKTVAMQFVSARDGRRVYHVTLAPIAGAGLVLSMHDATAQHELNLAKNEMVSLVSHELRTPLTSIVGYSEMLLKYGLVQTKGQQFLGAIIDESHRLSKLIQSFLDIAYIESGRQKISKTEFELGPVFRDMMTVLEPVAAVKNIALSAPVDGLTRVHADRLLLYQAVSNLVTNAIKYSPSGTSVQITVSNGNGAVDFRVSDEGCGIPSEDAARIFEKFYRRANKETLEQSGFGLGLAFVKEVANRHGGEVKVESEVGKGSTFTLSIPN